MSEPTINEMLALLAYLEEGTIYLTDRDKVVMKAIRHTLEQVNLMEQLHQDQWPPEIKWADYIKAGGR